MPKIQLLNGDSGKLEDFEPVDAREILSDPDTVYSVPDGASEDMGKQLSGAPVGNPDNAVSIPQLQGGDEEMQTGLSIEKYGRAAVVKAMPGNVVVATALRPTSTSGRALPGANEDAASYALKSQRSDGMTVPELRAALEKKNVAYPTDAKKAELADLLDKA